MTILAICFLILGVAFAMVFISAFLLNRMLLELGCGLAFINLVFGFGAACCALTAKSESVILMPYEIARSQYSVYAKCEGIKLDSTEARIVMSSNNEIRVEKTIQYNSYNYQIDCNYKIVLADGSK